jgi:hypothetical protein
MRRQAEFLDVLLRGAGPSVELLSAFALGLLMVGILSNLVFQLLTEPGVAPPAIGRVLLTALLFTGLAYALYQRDRSRRRTVQAEVDEGRLAPPHPRLIWILGPGPFDHLLFALEHHVRGGGGTHCWLVMQDTPLVQEAFNKLSQTLLEHGISTRLHPLYIERMDVRAAYEAVRVVFDQEAAREGLSPDQVIADITGGTKPLTAGMVLATLTTGGALEYVESDRDAHGNPIPSTLRVVLVDAEFYLDHET